MTQKAIIYCRVSTVGQKKGASPELQKEKCLAYAENNNIEVVDVVSEAFTSSTLDRPLFNTVLDRLYNGYANTLIAYDSDRITRVALHYDMLRHDFAEKGIRLHLVSRGEILVGDFAHNVREDIFGRFGQEWRRKLVQVMQDNRIDFVEKRGLILAKTPKLGYEFCYETIEINNKQRKIKRYAINQEGADIIRRIFDWYAYSGYSVSKIVRKCNELSLAGRHWYYQGISKILNDTAYIGEWKYKSKQYEKTITVTIPRIIDDRTWEAVRTKRDRTKNDKPDRIKHEGVIVRRIVSCGHCGSKMCIVMREGRLYMKCPNQRAEKKRIACTNQLMYRVNVLENNVWPRVEYLLKNPDKMRDFIQSAISADSEPKRLIGLIDSTKKLIAEKENDFDDLVEKVMKFKGKLADRLQVQATQLENDIEALETELKVLETRLNEEMITPQQLDSYVQLAYDIGQGVDKLTGDEKNAILRRLQVEVTINGKFGNRKTKNYDINVICLFGGLDPYINANGYQQYSKGLILDLTKLPINQTVPA